MKKTGIYKVSAMLLAVVCAGGMMVYKTDGEAAKNKKLSFSKSVKELKKGSTCTFKVSGVKNDGISVIWSTSNPKIAKISKKGKVTAVKKGTVKITAIIAGNGKSISQKLTITGKKKRPEEPEKNEKAPVVIEELLYGDETVKEEVYQEKEVENNLVKNLSKQAEKIENVAFDMIGFSESNDINHFCYSVFEKSMKENRQNTVVSPLSAYLALALAAEGAQGETKEQFDALLGDSYIIDRIHQMRYSFMQISDRTKLSIADSVWIDDEFEADAAWLSKMANFYEAEIFQSDLCTDMARKGMNNWVSNQTKGLIPSLFEQNLSKDARLVLMNTIYLKAKWKHEFEEHATYEREFTNENEEKVFVDFMNEYRVQRSYFKTEEADGVVLPYDDGRLALIAIRPQAGQNVREFAQELTQEKVNGYLKSAKDTYMNLHLPKFTMEYSVSMKDILKELGLTNAFDEKKAELTGLGKTKGMDDSNPYISEVLQKVKIQVDEAGTEAAAATAVIVCETASAVVVEEREPIEVDFNEPFVYIIADTKSPFGEEGTNAVPLFMGAVTELQK